MINNYCQLVGLRMSERRNEGQDITRYTGDPTERQQQYTVIGQRGKGVQQGEDQERTGRGGMRGSRQSRP